MTSAPILTLPDGTDDFIVYCDASHVGLSFVLILHSKVLAYDSQKYKVNKRNYLTHVLELVIIVFTLKILCHYLYVDACKHLFRS